MTTKNSKGDPFKSLLAAARKITPATLRGDKGVLWDQLVARFCAGDLDGVPHLTIYNWCKEHLGVNCGRETIRRALADARRVHARD